MSLVDCEENAMKYTYIPSGICPSEITIEIEGDILKSVNFEGGCSGNLQALSKLIEGMPVSVVKEKLSGIKSISVISY